mmetsp:Transcript_19693/g.33790  ORF Transcript_19693/g.33790 Transcript_19693/m.33790 type:complete len:414 (-) Transcript_19693:203-1444(-)
MYSQYRVNYQLRAHRRDSFIEFIKSLLQTTFVLASPAPVASSAAQSDAAATASANRQAGYADTFGRLEELIEEHRLVVRPAVSRLSTVVPTIRSFFTALPLRAAFLQYDARYKVSSRNFIPPSFNDIRHILNLAQVTAIAPHLRLVTLDGDQTLYEDGGSLKPNSCMADLLLELMCRGIYVAVVTAAGYPGEPLKYMQRLAGLFEQFTQRDVSCDVLSRFYVLGGECNYLFECGRIAHDVQLFPVPPHKFNTAHSVLSQGDHAAALVALAEETLRERISAMDLKVEVLRKPTAVGIVPHAAASLPTREQLDEVVLAVQHRLSSSELHSVPYCAFNGGRDVWVDVGNKLIGVELLQQYLACAPHQTLHIGDQFLSTGNDIATRSASCTVWITNPLETENVLRDVLTVPAAMNRA